MISRWRTSTENYGAQVVAGMAEFGDCSNAHLMSLREYHKQTRNITTHLYGTEIPPTCKRIWLRSTVHTKLCIFVLQKQRTPRKMPRNGWRDPTGELTTLPEIPSLTLSHYRLWHSSVVPLFRPIFHTLRHFMQDNNKKYAIRYKMDM